MVTLHVPEKQPMEKIFLGNFFCFIETSYFNHQPWLQRLVRPEPSGTYIVPRFLSEQFEIEHHKLNNAKIPRLRLTSITSDKMLYNAGQDAVNLLFFAPESRERRRQVVVMCNGHEYQRQQVELRKNGEGTLTLRDLPSGSYAVKFDRETSEEFFCEFTVAEYKLVPLTANIENKVVDAKGNLTATLKLESFGQPVEGAVKVDLLDNGRRLHSSNEACTNGFLHIRFALSGAGPHQLSLQLEDEPGKTASVPIIGSREHERTTTLFSPLGVELNGSLLPASECQELRGIYFTEGATRNTPIAYVGVKNGKAIFEVKQRFANLVAASFDPLQPIPGIFGGVFGDQNHPANSDKNYTQAEELFKNGAYAEALSIFQECVDKRDMNHPNYAYYEACCYARMGQTAAAVEALKRSIYDGWNDMEYIKKDPDLKSLQGDLAFERLMLGGAHIHDFGAVEAGTEIEVEASRAAQLIALAGVTLTDNWEGWTVAVAPSSINKEIEIEANPQPGRKTTIELKGLAPSSSVYCTVRDARLIVSDTPESRLASRVKELAEAASKECKVGLVTETMQKQMDAQWDTARTAYPPPPMAGGSWGAPVYASAPAPGSAPRSSPSLGSPAGGGGFGAIGDFLGGMVRRRATAPEAMPRAEYAREPANREVDNMSATAMTTGSAPGVMPQSFAATGAMDQSITLSPGSGLEGAKLASSTGSNVMTQPSPEMSPASTSQINTDGLSALKSKEPEVLYSAFVAIVDGVARLSLDLPDTFADYQIDCFITTGDDWAFATRRFQAQKEEFVKLDLPLFASASDETTGSVYARSSRNVQVKVSRDGTQLELAKDPNQVDGSVLKRYDFSAAPGIYKVELLTSDGSVIDSDSMPVQEVGKLKAEVSSVRLLQSGESISIDASKGIKNLSVLPGIATTLDVMVCATADYSHACCEQTAAKLLAACAMYMLSGDDGKKKKDAESMFVAGIKREETMWVKGTGLRAYPGQNIHEYYGQLAVRHLWNLYPIARLADDSKNAREFSAEMRKHIKIGLEIAEDVAKAMKLSPGKDGKFVACQDAYNALMLDDSADTLANGLKYVRRFLDGSERPTRHPFLGEKVFEREQNSFASALLLRSKETTDILKALDLADQVCSQMNQDGRLYSTVDSAAAIAMLSELRSKFAAKQGQYELNNGEDDGRILSDPFESERSIHTIKALDGCVAVQVTRVVEEDWDKFNSTVDITVALTADGKPVTKVNKTNELELVVTINSGYKEGDILWVCLPNSLSRILGGGQIKLFSMDFQGEKSVRIPLAATALTIRRDGSSRPEKFAVCLRNMYDEDRCGNPGALKVSVS